MSFIVLRLTLTVEGLTCLFSERGTIDGSVDDKAVVLVNVAPFSFNISSSVPFDLK